MLTVYVPTRGRIHSQKAMEFFRLEKVQKKRLARVFFVNARCEAAAFKRKYPWTHVLAVNDDWKTGDISQFIREHHEYDDNWRYKVLIDDDMQLLRRRDPNSVSQKGGTATDQDAFDALERIEWWFKKGYVHGAFSMRQVNHYCPEPYCENTRACGLLFFDSEVVRIEKIRFDAVQERQDFHVVLSLLELGYSNIVDYEFICGQYMSGTNASGGCSRYRTYAYMVEQGRKLEALHPGVVKATYKRLKNQDTRALCNEKGEIPDVRIGWRKACGLRADARRNQKLKGLKLCSG